MGMGLMAGRRASYALIVLAVLGCGRNEGAPQVTSVQAVAAVRGFDAADIPASLDRLNSASFGDAALVPGLAPFLKDPDPIRRWAGTYLVALLVDKGTAHFLTPVLQDSQPALRVIAAGSLAGLGVSEALPVLIDGLGTDALLPYHDPPKAVAAFARQTLEALTGKKFITQAEWRDWWAGIGAKIRWNGERYVAS